MVQKVSSVCSSKWKTSGASLAIAQARSLFKYSNDFIKRGSLSCGNWNPISYSTSAASAVDIDQQPRATKWREAEKSTMVNNGGSRPLVIGVAGGTAAGKTSLCMRITSMLQEDLRSRVTIIGQDSFYKDLDDDGKSKLSQGLYNFDHPSSIDFDQIVQILQDIRKRLPVHIPVYDFKENRRTDQTVNVMPADVYLVEGILMFYYPAVRTLFDLKIFVDVDADIRLARRIQRDITERGRNLTSVLDQYLTFVKPSFEQFCMPTMQYADIVLPRGTNNTVGIGVIVNQIEYTLLNRKTTAV